MIRIIPGRPATPRKLVLSMLLGVSILTACSAGGPDAGAQAPAPAPAQDLQLVFTYGSEKEKWVTDVTEVYNKAGHKLADGRRIQVKPVPMGSGEAMEELLTETGQKAHLTSPASGAFIELYNARSQQKTGKALVGETRNLLLSPVVIAMWKPMAEALGWPKEPIGWADVLKLARDPKGWAALEHPEWGSFKFAHTHPKFSNSGLIAVLAEVYAGAGKTRGLTVADVTKEETARFVADIERAVVHYGSSTGFFGAKMFANGPQALSAAVLYENMVIESYARPAKAEAAPEADAYDRDRFPVVAIYPKEGTFWSDHPVGVVEREWVTDEHRAAAQDFIAFLLAGPQQAKAIASGFRPGDESIELTSPPFDAAHGVDRDEPKALLAVPSGEVMEAILQLWDKQKKHSQVVLVIDASGSMRAGGRMVSAQNSAAEALGLLGDDDYLSIIVFNDQPVLALKEVAVKEGRAQAQRVVDGIIPQRETALYDAVQMAHASLQEHPKEGYISAVVVLSDGADNKSKTTLDELAAAIRVDNERATTRVFTIHYEAGVLKTVMERIARETQAKSYEGTTENILKVMKDIFTFF